MPKYCKKCQKSIRKLKRWIQWVRAFEKRKQHWYHQIPQTNPKSIGPTIIRPYGMDMVVTNSNGSSHLVPYNINELRVIYDKEWDTKDWVGLDYSDSDKLWYLQPLPPYERACTIKFKDVRIRFKRKRKQWRK